MKTTTTLTTALVLLAAGTLSTQAELFYHFDSDAEGFQNVTWSTNSGGSVQQTHTAGGWQSKLTKEFAWGPGGGNANQQLEMQSLAWSADTALLSFDVRVDGSSFPAGVAGWYQLAVVGNSDGVAGWTQIDKLVDSWQNADQADLRSWHFDIAWSRLGWESGDTWFQFYTIANSDAAFPVNFYLDNVAVQLVPEPTSLSLFGLGGLALLIRRRKN